MVPCIYDYAGLYIFNVQPNKTLLDEISEHYLLLIFFQIPKNKDYIQAQQTAMHDRKKTFIFEFNGDI